MNIEMANRLVQLRKASGLTQEGLAEKLGVSRQAVSKWERAEAAPDTDNLVLLSRLHNVSLDALFFTNDPVEAGVPVSAEPTEENETGGTDGGELVAEEGDEEESGGWYSSPLRITLDATFPVLLALIYLLLGFAGGWWHPGWLIFLTIPLYYCLPNAVRSARGVQGAFRKALIFLRELPYPVLIAAVYLSLGIMANWWHPGWVLFLTIPMVYGIPLN